ncbi:hypothetical protein [Micromonospora sp. NPDC049497]|uniref:hypothetical protein n=1 Tax=Micromonospora sp. NPDC049497 TaxID=3364273 RepID=UPI0037A3D999
MLNAFLQALAPKLLEAVLVPLVTWLAPRLLRSVPHRASPNCPRCGEYGVRRWAPPGVWVVFLLSIFAFAMGFTFTLLGLPFAVLGLAVSVATDGIAGLPRGLLALTGPVVPAAMMILGALGLGFYQSYPPKWCARCQARWPRRSRAEHLRDAGAVVFGCACGQRLRVPATAAGRAIRCPRCGAARRTAPTVDDTPGRVRPGRRV